MGEDSRVGEFVPTSWLLRVSPVSAKKEVVKRATNHNTTHHFPIGRRFQLTPLTLLSTGENFGENSSSWVILCNS
jgi:hypothetical protein